MHNFGKKRDVHLGYLKPSVRILLTIESKPFNVFIQGWPRKELRYPIMFLFQRIMNRTPANLRFADASQVKTPYAAEVQR